MLRALPRACAGAPRSTTPSRACCTRPAWAAAWGDEGGFAPNLKTNAEPFEYITKAVEKAGFKPGVDFMYAMDPASTEFYNAETGMYELKGEGVEYTSAQMVDYWEKLVDTYPIISIEDGMAEEDWDAGSSSPAALATRCSS